MKYPEVHTRNKSLFAGSGTRFSTSILSTFFSQVSGAEIKDFTKIKFKNHFRQDIKIYVRKVI